MVNRANRSHQRPPGNYFRSIDKYVFALQLTCILKILYGLCKEFKEMCLVAQWTKLVIKTLASSFLLMQRQMTVAQVASVTHMATWETWWEFQRSWLWPDPAPLWTLRRWIDTWKSSVCISFSLSLSLSSSLLPFLSLCFWNKHFEKKCTLWNKNTWIWKFLAAKETKHSTLFSPKVFEVLIFTHSTQ